MNKHEERAYDQGYKMAYSHMLRECLRGLGYDSLETKKVAWITEREGAINALRNICRYHGDNDWPDELNLGDIIEKHLGRYLDEEGEKEDDTGEDKGEGNGAC